MPIEQTYYNNLYAQIWRPEREGQVPLAIFFHGFLSSIKEFGQELPKELVKNNIACLLFDFRGHGQSKGKRGYVTMETLAEDSKIIIDKVKSFTWVDKNKIIALGHSLGTTPSLLNSSEFSTLILLAPPAKLWDKLNIFEKSLYPIVYYSIALPINFIFNLLRLPYEFKVPYKFKKKHIFKSKDCARLAVIDLQKFSPAENFKLIREHDNLSLAEKNNKPTLILVGKYDRATGVKDANKIYNVLLTSNKELKVFENSGHSILLDQEGEKVANYIVGWIRKLIVL